MANTQPYEVIVGSADVWVAAVATAFPAVNAAPNGSWTALGRTSGGVRVQHEQDIELIYVDQNTGPIKAVRTQEGLSIEMEFANLTLENMAKVLNNCTVTSDAGPPATKRIPLHQGFDVAQFALLARGPSPYGDFKMQYEVPVVIQMDEPQVEYQRDDKAVLSVRWTALEDFNQGTDNLKFGVLRAQSA